MREFNNLKWKTEVSENFAMPGKIKFKQIALNFCLSLVTFVAALEIESKERVC